MCGAVKSHRAAHLFLDQEEEDYDGKRSFGDARDMQVFPGCTRS